MLNRTNFLSPINFSIIKRKKAKFITDILFNKLLFVVLLLFLSQANAADTKFQNIDRYARFTPPDFEKSVEMLARYLMDGAENDVEKVRAFYVWIADNISYDTKSYFRRQYPSQSPQAVLKQRTAVCQGYANLFKQFCDIANFPCIEISGFSKGYGTNPAYIPEEPNHVWNAVQVDEQWRLIDVTWASGYIDKNRRFVKRFSDYYFFPDPAELIFTHFPANHNYQLLLISKTKEEFLDQMKLTPEWFEYGLKAISHRRSIIITAQPQNIFIKTPDNVVLAAKLVQSEKVLDERYTFVQKRDSLTEISLFFPDNDIFTLDIYAKFMADSGVFNYVSEYWFDVRNVEKLTGKFPVPFKSFYEYNCYLYNPLETIVQVEGEKHIEISAPSAEKTAIVIDSKWIYFENTGNNIFKGIIPNTAEDIIVYALFPGDTKFQALLNFTANTK